MSDQLGALRLFVLIARTCSFTRAARELKVSHYRRESMRK
jgi:DNA-binding transcriptional LysR family regulator